MDLFIGRDSAKDVFKLIVDELQSLEELASQPA
jgi:hypothetical protein